MMRVRLAGAAAAVLVTFAGLFVAGFVSSSDPSSARAAVSCEMIGFQNGVLASMNRLRRLDPGGTNATGTGAWDKLERTLLILVHEHDAGCSIPPPPPVTTTAPTTTAPPALVAPLTYNAEGGSNARYCVQGLPTNGAGKRFDDFATYDENGLQLGGRTENPVPGLKGARSTDGRGPCDPYSWGDRSFPPWPAESYQR